MKTRMIALALCVLPISAAATGKAGAQIFPAQGVSALIVDSSAGEITVQGTTGDKITVEGMRDNAKLCAVDINIKDGKLVINERLKSNHLGGKEKLGFKILVPSTVPVVINAGMGSIKLSKLNSATEVNVGAGSVDLQSVSGALLIKIGMGSLTGKDITSANTNLSVDGNIDLSGLTGALRLAGGMSSAKLQWAAAPTAGEINISVTGPLEMSFPAAAKLNFRLPASGKIANDFVSAADGVPLTVTSALSSTISIRKTKKGKNKDVTK